MKKIWAILLALLLIPAAAAAMEQSGTPPKFSIPWGNSAGSAYIRSIPTPSQIGIQNCAASLTDGFPPLTFTPSIAGGCPPDGRDFNGILKQVTQWAQWQSAGGPVFYDSAFASSGANGYPRGAIVMSSVVPGDMWMSTADNNTTNPDAGGANWVQSPGQIPIGTPVQALTSTVPYGYVAANALTVGNASSNATGLADATTQFLFAFIWSNCPNTQCPIFTSAGSASTRGVNAVADYAGNKAIATPNLKGSGLIGVDTMGGSASTFLSGVPVTVGSTTVPGSLIGENLHTLTPTESAHLTYSPSGNANNFQVSGSANNFTYLDAGATIRNIGSLPGGSTFGLANGTQATAALNGLILSTNAGGGAHNTVERSTTVYWNLKL